MGGVSASLSGVQTAGMAMAVAANNVANLNSADYKARRLDQETTANGGVQAAALRESQEPTSPNGSNVDLATEAVAMKTDKVTYEANLQFLQIQNSMLGAALDMKA